MNADNSVGSVLLDEPVNGTGLRFGKRIESELFVVKTVGRCKIAVQIHAISVKTAVVGHSVGVGQR